MRKLGNILAVALVALALCADRAAAAMPAVRPQISQVTRQAVRQLSRRFQHVVPGVKIVQNRQEFVCRPTVVDLISLQPVVLAHDTESMPFRFRLPPPLI